MKQKYAISKRQSRHCLTHWQRLLLISTIFCSGNTLATLISSQVAYATINCNAGNGGNGGNAINSNGADGGIGGDCVFGGQKIFTAGGPIENNGTTRDNQSNSNLAP